MSEQLPPVPVPPVQSENSGLAIASLVLGFLSIPVSFCYGAGLPLAIAAVITGNIDRSRSIKEGKKVGGMTKAGLIMGWIVIGLGILAVIIIAILLILGPTIGNVFSEINSNMVSP